MFQNRHKSSIFIDEKPFFQQKEIEIIQHLEPEQYLYEFPPRSQISEDSYFDDYSSISSNHIDSLNESIDQYLDSFLHQTMVSDNQLSPLQLPIVTNNCYIDNDDANVDDRQLVRPSSFFISEKDRINWDESSFYFPDYSINSQPKVGVHPFSRRNSFETSSNKTVIIKLNNQKPTIYIQHIHTDEGYHDEEEEDYIKELPLESTSCFISLSDDLSIKEEAAIKIQSLWRGYAFRKKHKISSNLVLAGLVQINNHIHRNKYNQLESRLELAEKNLEKETAMRMAFEKTMEDMTILIDQQHQVFNHRLEQEIQMRKVYENKLESIENSQQQLLNQLENLKLQFNQQLEQNSRLQSQLSSVNEERKKPSVVSKTQQDRLTPSRLSNKKSIPSLSSNTKKPTTSLHNTTTRKSTVPLYSSTKKSTVPLTTTKQSVVSLNSNNRKVEVINSSNKSSKRPTMNTKSTITNLSRIKKTTTTTTL